MEKDFHYHLTYAAAKLTELPNAEVVAYTCQFVDDNNEGQFSIGGSNAFFPEKLRAGGFEKTDWYRFHQAAKVHLADVMELIKGI